MVLFIQKSFPASLEVASDPPPLCNDRRLNAAAEALGNTGKEEIKQNKTKRSICCNTKKKMVMC